jgi:hypothetical protein
MRVVNRPSILFSLFALIFCCSTTSWSQSGEHKPDACSDSKRGLHATLNAEPGYYGDPRLVTLTFRLMNDSDQVSYSDMVSWTLVIDDREVPDPGGQLWIGPASYRRIWKRRVRLDVPVRQGIADPRVFP